MSIFSNIFGGAASGAATGAMVGGPWGAAAGGILGGALGFFSGRSEQEAARAQGAAAEAQLAEARSTRQQALGYAGASSSELAARQQLLELQSQVLGRTNRELEFLQRGLDMRSPGAAEAGQGLFSSIIMRQRQAQRSQLESTLRSRFGSGYATTSAGQAALQQFDQGTADVATQAIPQFLNTAYGAIGQTTQLENVLSSRQVNALNATPITPYAGAPFVGQIAQSRADAQMFQNLMNVGTTLGTAYFAGKKGGNISVDVSTPPVAAPSGPSGITSGIPGGGGYFIQNTGEAGYNPNWVGVPGYGR